MPLAALGPILMGAAGVSTAATTAAWGAIGAGASGALGLVGASKQAGAMEDAARMQTEASKYAADKQDAATQRAETFQREQADYVAKQTELDRHANYDQYVAHRKYVGSLGQMLGLGNGGDVPAYVPSVDPRFTMTSGSPQPGASGPRSAPPPGAAVPPGMSIGAMADRGGAMSFRPAPAAASPPTDPRLAQLRARMGGTTGVASPLGTPVLQPDGTYAFTPSMPRTRSFGDYVGAA